VSKAPTSGVAATEPVFQSDGLYVFVLSLDDGFVFEIPSLSMRERDEKMKIVRSSANEFYVT
jgi:hypothetical protein